MADKKEIHEFAVKWRDKFSDPNVNYMELVDHHMADDCAVLGFEMDCGYAFLEKYGNAADNNEALKEIIDEITDIPLLGSAVYSRWRYFNHWAYSGAEILQPENREWFLLAFNRLALLSEERPFAFQGTLEKLRLVSNNICFGPAPEPWEEAEQHITIDHEGYVCFAGYGFGSEGESREKLREKAFKIRQSAVDGLFAAVSGYFGREYTEVFATDIGVWEMELTNTEGVTYQFRGSLCADFDFEGVDLSDFVRDTLGMDDLFVFNGKCRPDVINRITLDYHRVTKIKPDQKPEGADWEFVTWDYTERLMIDRTTETLEHVQNIGTECRVSRRYEIADGISSLLDNFTVEELFAYIAGNSDDAVDNPDESMDYTIMIDYKTKPRRTITGSFDKKGLPEDFADFIETVFGFMRFYGDGEIFDPGRYGKRKR